MEIQIKLDKDFERYFYNLKEEYGEDFATLNGLSDEQLSYNDFLDNFSEHVFSAPLYGQIKLQFPASRPSMRMFWPVQKRFFTAIK